MWATSRLIAPPLPLASQPSKTRQTGGPSRRIPSAKGIIPPSASRRCESRSPPCSRRWASSSGESFSERSSWSRRPIAAPSSHGDARLGLPNLRKVAPRLGKVGETSVHLAYEQDPQARSDHFGGRSPSRRVALHHPALVGHGLPPWLSPPRRPAPLQHRAARHVPRVARVRRPAPHPGSS